jgi:hypothetical protein
MKRGQAALEFMMTYGWAILVVLAAIGALSYFGVLNPTRLTPDTCLASSGFGCAGKPLITYDRTALTSSLSFTIVNGMGITVPFDPADMTVSEALTGLGCTPASVQFCDRGGVLNCAAAPRNLQDGASMTIVIADNGCDFSNSDVIRGGLDFTFANPQSALVDTFSFTFGGRVRFIN